MRQDFVCTAERGNPVKQCVIFQSQLPGMRIHNADASTNLIDGRLRHLWPQCHSRPWDRSTEARTVLVLQGAALCLIVINHLGKRRVVSSQPKCLSQCTHALSVCRLRQ